MHEEIRKLVLEEQATGMIFRDIDIDAYLAKLLSTAELFISLDKGQCQGFIAYYCNDEVSRIAYVSLILVAPAYRSSKTGYLLTHMVLEQARLRGFAACRLEVRKINLQAQAFYRKLGFEQVEERAEKYLLERRL
jgi:ribosomal protein S18 acetylase RimI-like enzyme